jgi:hypothetical protein
MTTDIKKPKVSTSMAQQEIDKVEQQFESFDKNVKELTLDRMNSAPKEDSEPQTKLSQSEIEKSKDIYLKPTTYIPSKEKFNEKFRDDYNFSCEYVNFIPEHKEAQGDVIECWSKPYPGMPANFWKIPTGKPVWGPRYLAEQLSGCKYHRLKMNQTISTGANIGGQYFGAMAVDTVIQRLDAIPVSNRKSIFMGSRSF